MADPRGQHSSDTLLPPQLPPLGKFTLLREIGRGGMGVVYEATDTATGRPVAVKILNAAPSLDPREAKPAEDRFLREARVASSIPPHPGIVGVYEAGVANGRRFIAMELVRGTPMSEWRKQASLTIQRHVSLIRSIALAAHHAHEAGVVHRDLKPENVLIDGDNQPHLTDFGLAQAAGPEGPALTATGTAVGTPYYMSPEQIQGRKDVDRRTDVYALGVLLYEILAGRRPFHGDSAFDLMTRAVNEAVVPPSRFSRVQINPILFRNLESICLIALSKDPADRYPTAHAFAEDLSKWLRGEEFKVIHPRTRRAVRTNRTVRRTLFAAAGTALLAAAALVFFGVGRKAPPPAAPALRPGVIAEVYSGTNFNAIGVRRIDARTRFENQDRALWPDGPSFWASYRWSGILQVPADGTYLFQVRSKEGVKLTIDGVRVVANWTFHPTAVDKGVAKLQAGPHRLVLEYCHTTPEQTLELSWRADTAPALAPITPATLAHDPAAFVPREPPGPGENGLVPVAGAQEAESLAVFETSGQKPLIKPYDTHRQFWRGTWSGKGHLWWGARVKPGDRLRLVFDSPSAGEKTVALAMTRGTDHGIYKILVNGTEIAPALDLFDEDLRTGEIEFKGVRLAAGANDLDFIVAGSNPTAREWGPGTGLYKMGLDYVVVK